MNPKHISMELTADGARVTNLKLDGGKLILTIEAQLADSQLTASDVDGSVEALAASLLPEAEKSPSPSSGRPTPDTGIFTVKPAPAPQPVPAPVMEMPTSPFGQPGFAAAPPVFAETPVDPARPTRPVEQHKPISFGEPPAAPGIGMGIDMDMGMASGMASVGMERPAFEQESASPFAAPVFETEAPVSGGISLGSDLLSFSPPPAAAAPQPQFQQPAPAPAPDRANPFAPPPGLSPPGLSPLAVSDESNAFGGARHGEPQPAISFGQDLLGQPAAPAVPQPMIMPDFGLAPVAAPGISPGISFEAPAPAPAPLLTPGIDLLPPSQPQPAVFGFAAQPAPAPAPVPAPVPEPMPMPAPMPAPAPAPVPQPAPAAAPEEKPRPEAGGTTVLIRYTCPKCKTQGMQAVDKVGTVVNCSNCGKAMRLVMKK